jgi:hypothetical protein
MWQNVYSRYFYTCFLILQILQFHFIDGENDEKVKRLLLNDPDVVGQISRMQNNINSLTQLVSQLTSKNCNI